MYVAALQYAQDTRAYLEGVHLEVSVNYAMDAATEEMIAAVDNSKVDYNVSSTVTVNPQEALNVFTTMMLMSLNWADNETNRLAFQNEYVPMFIVVGQDGYYLAKQTIVSSEGEYELRFGPKVPYNKDGKLYTLSGSTYRVYGENGNLHFTEYDCTIQESRNIVNAMITDVVNKVLADENLITDSLAYFPGQLSELNDSINAIKDVTLLAYVKGDGTDSINVKADAMMLGGTAITETTYTVAYEIDGVKYYTFASKFAGVQTNDSPTNIKMFESAQRAAEHGYMFDLSSMDY